MRFLTGGMFLVLITAACLALGQSGLQFSAPSPPPKPLEKLTFNVEWRLVHAGTVTMEKQPHQESLKLESAGIVSTLFPVEDFYTVNFEDSLCATSSFLDAMERKRHRETKVTYDRAMNHAFFVERDVALNKILKETGTDIPHCVSDVMGAFAKLRAMNLEVGQSTEIPVSDGRKSALVKVTAQQREEVRTPLGAFQAIRYQADLMNGVVYTRKGEVFLWLSDDSRRLPVQIRLRTGFPIGAVTVSLEKEEHP